MGDYGGQIVWPTDSLKIVQQSESEIVVSMDVYTIIVDDIRGDADTTELTLKKEDGKWKINSTLHCWD